MHGISPQVSQSSSDTTDRSSQLERLGRSEPFDLAIIGGGIHGAVLARLAAASGFSVALIDRADFGGATSSRSSKMAHGGLRYLELLDFQQVFEGIKARDDLFEHVGHLVKPQQFLIPVPAGRLLFKWKLGLGLFLYDMLLRDHSRRHSWIPRRDLSFAGFSSSRKDLMGCFSYTDGIMSDTRLVIENIIGARRHGAVCLNYCEATSRVRTPDGGSTLSAKDTLSGRALHFSARLVVNCAGPWVSQLAGQLGAEAPQLRFSRGSHIVFAKPWKGPSLFLPLEGKARYYFVWPHPAGTLVGTTEREVKELPNDPLPTRDEIDEILQRLERDIPDAGLRRENACYCYAGVRTLPLRGKSGASPTLSRKHIWSASDGVLTLSGGKYTTAWWTALEGLKSSAKLLNRELDARAVEANSSLKKLPGSMTGAEASQLEGMLQSESATERERLTARYGKRLLESFPMLAQGSAEHRIALEAEISLSTEQAETLEDLMRRRLELEMLPGHGIHHLPLLREVFMRLRPGADFDAQAVQYRERMEAIDLLLR